MWGRELLPPGSQELPYRCRGARAKQFYRFSSGPLLGETQELRLAQEESSSDPGPTTWGGTAVAHPTRSVRTATYPTAGISTRSTLPSRSYQIVLVSWPTRISSFLASVGRPSI